MNENEKQMNVVACPFCLREMDAYLPTGRSSDVPTTDNRSISICSNCTNVGMFHKLEGSSEIAIRKLTEEEWVDVITHSSSAWRDIQRATQALKEAKTHTVEASLDDYLHE